MTPDRHLPYRENPHAGRHACGDRTTTLHTLPPLRTLKVQMWGMACSGTVHGFHRESIDKTATKPLLTVLIRLVNLGLLTTLSAPFDPAEHLARHMQKKHASFFTAILSNVVVICCCNLLSILPLSSGMTFFFLNDENKLSRW